MNASSLAPLAPSISRFDAKFIEEHQLIERYLQNKLPAKGALDLETWCRENPHYLEGLNLADRAQASLKLLEACGKPVDLTEPKLPWWKSTYLPIGLGALALISSIGFWLILGKLMLTRGALEDARTQMRQGSLVQPSTESNLQIAPDRAPGINHARLSVNHSAPQLMDLHIDMSYTKSTQFRLVVDKQDQGRALILNNVLKDSNNELRLTFNTTGLAMGTYPVRIEALPYHANGNPIPEGWLTLEVH